MQPLKPRGKPRGFRDPCWTYRSNGMTTDSETLGLADAYAQKLRLEAEAGAVMEAVAKELADLIPESLQRYAIERSWIQQEPDGWWELPKLLNLILEGSRREPEAHPWVLEYTECSEAATLIGNDLDEVEAALKELAEAWEKHLRIRVTRSESAVCAWIYVIGVEYPEWINGGEE